MTDSVKETTLTRRPKTKSQRAGGLSGLFRFFGVASGGDIDADEAQVPEAGSVARSLIDQARAFHALRISDLMTPRVDITALEISASLREVLRVCIESEHSRLPIFRETLDDPVGVLHIKDLLKALAEDETKPSKPLWDEPILQRLRREVLYVPLSMTAAELLLQMQAKRIHMALVIDEFGGTDGLITLEDLIEAVVGDIEDEYDDETEDHLVAISDSQYEADGRVELTQFEERFGVNLYPQDTEEEVDTLAGLVSFLAGRVPQRGEVIPHPQAGFDIEVVDADARRIKRVKLHRCVEPSGPLTDDPHP